MIKKVFIISSILFFGFAGNVFATKSGDVFRSDVIWDNLECSAMSNNFPAYASVMFYNQPSGPAFAFAGCHAQAPAGVRLLTFGEVWGEEYNNQIIYLNEADGSSEVAECKADFSWCRANVTSCSPDCFSQIVLRPDPPTILAMPETASSDILVANVGGLFTDFWPIITIMFGIPLAFYIIPRVIELVVVRNKS